ncbi:unnamed protein product [Lampetra fluviatilis]
MQPVWAPIRCGASQRHLRRVTGMGPENEVLVRAMSASRRRDTRAATLRTRRGGSVGQGTGPLPAKDGFESRASRI